MDQEQDNSQRMEEHPIDGEGPVPDGSPKKGGRTKMWIGILIGVALGYAYHRLVGCSTGACPIVANPWYSMIYGGTIGFLFTHSV